MGWFSWFCKKKADKESSINWIEERQSQFQKKLAEMPQCWLVHSFYEYEEIIYPPRMDSGKLEHEDDSEYCTIHDRWEPTSKYDCGGMASGGIEYEIVFLKEEDAKSEYARAMVDYANALVNKGFLLLCEYSKDR